VAQTYRKRIKEPEVHDLLQCEYGGSPEPVPTGRDCTTFVGFR